MTHMVNRPGAVQFRLSPLNPIGQFLVDEIHSASVATLCFGFLDCDAC